MKGRQPTFAWQEGNREFEKQRKAQESTENKNNEDFDASTSKDLNTFGLAFILEGKDDLAETLFLHKRKVYPADEYALLSLALFYLKQKNKKARELCEQALNLNPGNPWVREIMWQLNAD